MSLKKETRYANFKDLSKYKNAVCSAKSYAEIKREYEEKLSAKDAREEEIMLGLRTYKGVKEEIMPPVAHSLESISSEKTAAFRSIARVWRL